MAMLIAWQTVNAVRHPGSRNYSRAFLVITPGITIKDRLRVLLPNDPNSYYRERELVPNDMLGDIERSKIIITNYHAFGRRERIEVSKTGRALLQGHGPELNTLETEGQMLLRACGDLMGLTHIVVLNDEAHHCYREKPQAEDGEKLSGEDKEEAKKKQRGGAAVDFGHRDRQAQARPHRGPRFVGNAVLPARIGLCRGHPFPVDGQRLLADGRDRVRHRQIAARAGRRQHPGR